MKSKRRHELQTNDLADRIGHVIERLRPYATTILAVLVAFAVVISAWYYLAASRERNLANGWRAYFSAGTDPQADITVQLSEVADNYGDTPAGLWAAQTAADISLAQGVQMMFADRAEAETNIEKAKGLYKQVLDSKLAKSYPMLLQRARFGLAQAHETLNELDDAKKYYKLVAEANPESPLGKAAKERLEKLADPDVEKWYNWFARQQPAPPAPAQQPSSSLGGGAPLGNGLPSLSGLSDTPDIDASDTDANAAKSPTTGGTKSSTADGTANAPKKKADAHAATPGPKPKMPAKAAKPTPNSDGVKKPS